jgi:hypothetical protein
MPGAPKGQPKSRKKPPLRDEEKHTVPNTKPHVRLQRLSALVLAGAVLLLPYPGGRSAAALVADAPSTPVGWAWRILRSLPPDGLLSLLVLLSLGLLLLSCLRFGKEAWRPLASQCDIPVVLFIVLAFASIGWTVSTHATLTEAARRAGQALFFMLVFQLAGLGYGGVLAVAASASAGLQGLLAVREYLASWSAGDPTWRTFGTFINPNALASYMLTFLPISVALYLTCAPSVAGAGRSFGSPAGGRPSAYRLKGRLACRRRRSGCLAWTKRQKLFAAAVESAGRDGIDLRRTNPSGLFASQG